MLLKIHMKDQQTSEVLQTHHPSTVNSHFLILCYPEKKSITILNTPTVSEVSESMGISLQQAGVVVLR